MSKLLVHIIPAISINCLIQIIIHEIGHMVGGLITGWNLLYIQIHKLVLKTEDKGLKIERVSDLAYRCIMYPKSINLNALIYTMGGCIFNLWTSFLGFILLTMVEMPPLVWLYVWCFSAFGMGIYIINGIACTKRVCNDKACYNLLKADRQTRICHNAQLLIAKDLAKGLSYKEIGKDMICLSPDTVNNDIQVFQALLECYYYLDTRNMLSIGMTLKKIKNTEGVSKEITDILEMELIYVRLLCELKIHISKNPTNPNNLQGKLDSDIKGFEEAIIKHYREGDIHSLRVMSLYQVYKYYMAGDKSRVLEIIDKTINKIKKSNLVYKGDLVFCINQLLWVKGLVEYMAVAI